MKALTLTQPYASLVALGLKHYETRSFVTHHRGSLAIHAAQSVNGVGGKYAYERICQELPPLMRAILWNTYSGDLPFGEILAVTWVEDCIPTAEVDGDVDGDERAVGNYTSGRWAWRLRMPVLLIPAVRARGHQGIWNVEDDLISERARKAIRHAV